jgi:SP family xylose:H+ symportor-like MFS transporter
VGSLKAYFIDPRNLSDPNAANSLLGLCGSSALIGCIIGGAHRRLGEHQDRPQARIDHCRRALPVFRPGRRRAGISLCPHRPRRTGIHGEFCLYRILSGIGVGLASMLSPMYIAEIAPAKVRGNLVAWNQFAIIFGMLVIYFVNFGISKGGERRCLAQHHRLALHVPVRRHSRNPLPASCCFLCRKPRAS